MKMAWPFFLPLNHDLPEDYEGEDGPKRRPDDDRLRPERYGNPADEDRQECADWERERCSEERGIEYPVFGFSSPPVPDQSCDQRHADPARVVRVSRIVTF